MSIRFRCACGKALSAPDESAGKTARCPACGERVPIPAAAGRGGVVLLVVGALGVVALGLIGAAALLVTLFVLSAEGPVDPGPVAQGPAPAVPPPAPPPEVAPPKAGPAPEPPSPEPPSPEEPAAPEPEAPPARPSVKPPPEVPPPLPAEEPPAKRPPEPEPEPEPGPQAPPPAPKAKEPLRLLAPPLVFKLENDKPPPAEAKGEPDRVTLPVEVATVEDAKRRYRVRRLRLPEDAPRQLRLGVTKAVYDDMGGLLNRLGDGYRFTDLQDEDLANAAALQRFDVVFLTCAELQPEDSRAVKPLRRFVEGGGTLYASDLRCDLLLRTFPEFAMKAQVLPGVQQEIEATVVDKGLQAYLGHKKIPLNLESPDWRPAAFASSKVTTYLRGPYRDNAGRPYTVPLLVKFRVKRGTVIFTSFHNAKNDSEFVQKLLEFLVFSSVNARSEARVKELMQRNGFAPQELRTVALTAARPAALKYAHKSGGLQVALGFENLGARLRLTLKGPGGQMIEHEDRGLYLVEVPEAPAGEWEVTVTPVELPYATFPVVLAAGKAGP